MVSRSLVSIVLSLLFYAHAIASCDADVLSAMRTTFIGIKDDVLWKAAMEKACHSNADANSIGVEYMGIGVDFADSSLASACLLKDEKFFQRNSLRIAASYLPTDAIRTCGPGVYFTVTEPPSHKVVNFKATSQPTGSGDLAKVKKLTWHPAKSLSNCDGDLLHAGAVLIPEGIAASCDRSDDADSDITVTLSTNQGTKILYLARYPEILPHKFKWDHYVGHPDIYYKCKDVSEPENPVPYGDFIDCSKYEICGQSEEKSGFCATKFWTSYLTIDGQRIKN